MHTPLGNNRMKPEDKEACDALYAEVNTYASLKVRQSHQAFQRIRLRPMTEDLITTHDMAKVSEVTLAESASQQIAQPQDFTGTAGSAVIAGAGDLVAAALKYITNIVMTNIVSQSIFGIYITVYTAATIVGFITVLGMDSTIVRFLSMYRAKGEHELVAGLLRFVVWMTLITGLCCGFLFYLSATILARLVYHQERYILPLREVALLIPLMALQPVLASGLIALRAIRWKIYTDRLIQPALSLVLIGVFYVLGLRLQALILATICGFLASVIAGQLFLVRASKHLTHDVVPRFTPRPWLRFALPLSFNSFIYSILNSSDVLFLATFATAAQVGLYAAADRVSFLVLMPLVALNTIFSPQIAEYYSRGEHEQLANMASVVAKWAFSLSLPVFLCFCIFRTVILSIFSSGYTTAGTVLIILSLANLIDAGIGSTGDLLVMTGHTRTVLANTVVAIVINVVLSFLLIPRFNILGAAVASAVALVIPSLAGLIEVYMLLKIFTLRLDMLKAVVAGWVASIIGLLLLRIIHVAYGYQAIVGTLGLVISFLLIYGLVLFLLRLSKEDMLIFEAVCSRFSKNRLQ